MATIERERLHREIGDMAAQHDNRRTALLPILHMLMDTYGFISREAMQETADALHLRPVDVYSTVSFYTFFSTEPVGTHVIRLSTCMSSDIAGYRRVAAALENELGIRFGETTATGDITLEYTSCIGMCDQSPAMLVDGKVYTNVTPARVRNILEDFKGRFASGDDSGEQVAPNIRRSGVLLEKSGDHAGLRRAIGMNRTDILAEIRSSNIRGRGGAGFPTAVKWQLAAAAGGAEKYVVCNADEGEPGTFKDRLLLMEYAHDMFDGMTIGALAVGAHKGYLYLRAEYAFARQTLEAVLEERRQHNLLGADIGGREGFGFDIEIRLGAGAYICGEETALLESLEGKRGEPRNRPPFPVQNGFDMGPTIVNNVETFVAVARIMEHGGEWFARQGTEKSTGTKLFSVSGACERPGIYELPYGITVNELLGEVGGESAKAVQVGGASGSCIPARDFGRTIGYEDVSTGGSVIVFGPDQDMLDVAENFLAFFEEESCGQCVPCRKGCSRLLQGVEMLKAGVCSVSYADRLKDLGTTMQLASKCGLGQSAPNAFLAIMEHFGDEVFGRLPERRN